MFMLMKVVIVTFAEFSRESAKECWALIDKFAT
jgi:hypothetical protein